MPGQRIDRAANLQESTSVSAKTATTTATTTGTGVDTKGFRSVTGVAEFTSINSNTATAGSVSGALYESDDGSTYTAVAAADYQIYGDADLSFTYTDGADTRYVAYKGTKRYVNWVVTVAGSPTTGYVGEWRFALLDPDDAPANTAGA